MRDAEQCSGTEFRGSEQILRTTIWSAIFELVSTRQRPADISSALAALEQAAGPSVRFKRFSGARASPNGHFESSGGAGASLGHPFRVLWRHRCRHEQLFRSLWQRAVISSAKWFRSGLVAAVSSAQWLQSGPGAFGWAVHPFKEVAGQPPLAGQPATKGGAARLWLGSPPFQGSCWAAACGRAARNKGKGGPLLAGQPTLSRKLLGSPPLAGSGRPGAPK